MLLLAVFPTLYRRTGGSLYGRDGIQTTPQADSEVTLGVLCDQIEPSDDSMEDEDKTIRERLRALVAAFLAQDAQKHLLAQLQGHERGAAEQEDAPIDTFIEAVSKSSVVDAAKISSSFCPLSTTADAARERAWAPTARARRLSAQGGPRTRAEPGDPGGAVPALFLAPSPIKTGSSEFDLEIRQSNGSAHDTICGDVRGGFLSSNRR
ncbi:hypothetical protein EDB84DRAFT_339675 [Lactarius hengduanensis]|nr:hypothetical protein EDB84DRAFT_339675 [Lactarius hengduanensis]